MSTVIDELVVQLSLDPKNFTDEQRRLVDSLRRMEDAAGRGAQRVSDAAGRMTTQFFRALESPVAGLRRMFEGLAESSDEPRRRLRDLEDQGRRTGEGVEGGALAGARGLRVLGAAGLGVFAAYEALSKTISAANSGAQRLFSVGVGAAGAGMGIGQFTAISQAMSVFGAPQAETQALLSGWRSAQLGYARGDEASIAALQELNQAIARVPGLQGRGIDVWQGSVEHNMRGIAEGLAAMPEDQALSAARSLGISQEEAYGLMKAARSPGGYDRAVADALAATAATKGQHDAALELTQASGRLSNALDGLGQRMGALVDGPIARLEDVLTRLVNATSGQAGAEGAAVAGAALVPGAGPLVGAGVTVWDRVKGWLGLGGSTPSSAPVGPSAAGGTAAGAALLSSLGIAPGSPEWQIAMRESAGNPNIGWGMTDLSGYALDSTGFPDWSGRMGPAGVSTAAGLWQITRTNWHKYAPLLGIHDFSPESQYRVMRAMVAANHGYGDWGASGPTAFSAPPSGARLPSMSSRFVFGTDSPPPGAGGAGFDWSGHESQKDLARLRAELAAVQAERAREGADAARGPGDVNLNGDIVVHAPTREGYAIAGAVQDGVQRIQRVSIATTSNTGLTE